MVLSVTIPCSFHSSAEAALTPLMPLRKWVEDGVVFVLLLCFFGEDGEVVVVIGIVVIIVNVG